MQEYPIPQSVIKQEFYRSTEKFHVITCWVGMLLNLVWCISDYYVINAYFLPFFIFRLAVSGISALLVLTRKATGINIYSCMFMLVLGISVQNAYMWSVMDLAHFQKHVLAYLVLFIGAGMLILWELKFSLILAVITLAANYVFYKLNSPLPFDDFLTSGALLTLTVVVFSVFMIRTRYRLTYNEIRSRLELERSKVEIQTQKDALEAKNHEITDSINYAKNIQTALLPTEPGFNAHFKNSFVLFKPKDIVSGDFYWVYEKGDRVFYATADCTGHGVPGGFMTMLGLSFLTDIIEGQKVQDPAEVLNRMRDKIIMALKQTGSVGENKDGMDITICCIDKSKRELSFSSANNGLYIVKNTAGQKIFKEYKANRQPVGFYHTNTPFTGQTITLEEGDCIYTFTDGYADQFGGPKGKKFRYRQFEELLTANAHLDFKTQKHNLNQAVDQWRGTLEQVDDILVIGVSI